MSVSRRRVRAIFRKELREYRRNRTIVTGMAILPLLFLVQPLVAVLNLGASASGGLAHEHELLYLLAIPALVSATLASYSVVGERQQGTLEPVLGTPIRREEFLLGKALASFVPSVVISYAVYAFFLALVEIFAQPGVAPAVGTCNSAPRVSCCAYHQTVGRNTRTGCLDAEEMGRMHCSERELYEAGEEQPAPVRVLPGRWRPRSSPARRRRRTRSRRRRHRRGRRAARRQSTRRTCPRPPRCPRPRPRRCPLPASAGAGAAGRRRSPRRPGGSGPPP